jgi:hypothetical protein
LGHVISDEGIKVDLNKITEVTEWPSPKSITSLRGFLGLTRYYRSFVQKYAQIVAPLTSLLKKDAFKWNEKAEAYFRRLKILMASTPGFDSTGFIQNICP